MTNVNRRLVTDEVRELVVSALLSDPSYVLGRRHAEDAFDGWMQNTRSREGNIAYRDGYADGLRDGYNEGSQDVY